MKPKGTLIVIGGNEDKGVLTEFHNTVVHKTDFLTAGILCRLVNELEGKEGKIQIITTASTIPEIVGAHYLQAFNLLGCDRVSILNIREKEDAEAPEVIQSIEQAAGVLFSGGDQFRLVSVFKDTKVLEILKMKFENEDFILAGTSAGAMAMPDIMIYPGEEENAQFKSDVNVYKGFAFVKNLIIDTHFLARGRFRRLAQAVADHPHYHGIGIEEDTAVIIRGGNDAEVIGSGLVVIIDGNNSNKSDENIRIENLITHLISPGNHFIIGANNKVSA